MKSGELQVGKTYVADIDILYGPYEDLIGAIPDYELQNIKKYYTDAEGEIVFPAGTEFTVVSNSDGIVVCKFDCNEGDFVELDMIFEDEDFNFAEANSSEQADILLADDRRAELLPVRSDDSVNEEDDFGDDGGDIPDGGDDFGDDGGDFSEASEPVGLGYFDLEYNYTCADRTSLTIKRVGDKFYATGGVEGPNGWFEVLVSADTPEALQDALVEFLQENEVNVYELTKHIGG